jgi:hypothetical protein
VNEYFALVDQGAPFNDPKLAWMRERMTDDERMRIMAMLRASGEAELEEAAALRAYGRRKFGPHEVVEFPSGKR